MSSSICTNCSIPVSYVPPQVVCGLYETGRLHLQGNCGVVLAWLVLSLVSSPEIRRLTRMWFTGFLWLLWIASAAYTIDSNQYLLAICSANPGYAYNLTDACRDNRVSAVFGFFAWIVCESTLYGFSSIQRLIKGFVVLPHILALLAACIVARRRGESVWKSPITELKVDDVLRRGRWNPNTMTYYYPSTVTEAKDPLYSSTTDFASQQPISLPLTPGNPGAPNGRGASGGHPTRSIYPEV